jgi:hypothetical protein
MFSIDQDTVRFIRERSGSVVIRLKYEPAMGG